MEHTKASSSLIKNQKRFFTIKISSNSIKYLKTTKIDDDSGVREWVVGFRIWVDVAPDDLCRDGG